MLFGKMTVNTRVNTARYSIGFRVDHAAPRTEEVYFTFTSRRIRLANSSADRPSSLSRCNGCSRGGSEVRTTASELRARGTPLREERWAAARPESSNRPDQDREGPPDPLHAYVRLAR